MEDANTSKADPARPPTVTIVTPTFDRAPYLGATLASTRAQGFRDFEHLVVDDGSRDGTEAVVAPFLEDPRYRLLRQDHAGQSRARNRALARARGRYVAFLDSDDLWEPDKLEIQVAFLEEHPDVDVVYGDYRFIDAAGAPLPLRNMRRHSGRIVRHMLGDNCVSMNTTLVRRERLVQFGGFRELERADDYDLWLRLSAYCRFAYLPRVFAAYRVMEAQLSSDVDARLAANGEIVAHFLEQHGGALTPRERSRGLSRFHQRRSRHRGRGGDRLGAFRDAGRAIALAPTDPGSWRALARAVRPASAAPPSPGPGRPTLAAGPATVPSVPNRGEPQ